MTLTNAICAVVPNASAKLADFTPEVSEPSVPLPFKPRLSIFTSLNLYSVADQEGSSYTMAIAVEYLK